MHLRKLELCFYTGDSHGISGYILTHEGHEAIQLGPWAAHDERTAETLLQRVLKEIDDRQVFLDAPHPYRQANALMDKYGFRIERGFYRMYLGDNRNPGLPKQIYGTSGAEKG